MMGFCPYIKGSLKESECHHDGYCSECPHNTKDDTISRRAALDALKPLPTIEGLGLQALITVDDAIKILNGLPPAQPEPHWTPCSEELPKESETYIVTAYDGVSRRVTFVKYQKRLNRWDLSGARSYWHILAWMPLPESYRGEENGTGSI